jgi:hypothetical protein
MKIRNGSSLNFNPTPLRSLYVLVDQRCTSYALRASPARPQVFSATPSKSVRYLPVNTLKIRQILINILIIL